jgi:hypothetical protein
MTQLKYLLFLTASILIAQHSNAQKRNMESFDIIFGPRLFKSNFYNQVNTLDKYSFNSPLHLIGIGYSGRFTFERSTWLNFAGHTSYAQIIPSQLIINDTIKCNINGFIFSVCVLGWDFFPKSKNFHLLFSGGFNTGRLRLDGNELTRQKNLFFSPKLSLQPKIAIGKIILSVRGDYEWDISSKYWKPRRFATKEKIALDSFIGNGATILFCFGFGL